MDMRDENSGYILTLFPKTVYSLQPISYVRSRPHHVDVVYQRDSAEMLHCSWNLSNGMHLGPSSSIIVVLEAN